MQFHRGLRNYNIIVAYIGGEVNMEKECYLGLDIGTDSVGYAVTDEEYNLMRFKGNDAWTSRSTLWNFG